MSKPLSLLGIERNGPRCGSSRERAREGVVLPSAGQPRGPQHAPVGGPPLTHEGRPIRTRLVRECTRAGNGFRIVGRRRARRSRRTRIVPRGSVAHGAMRTRYPQVVVREGDALEVDFGQERLVRASLPTAGSAMSLRKSKRRWLRVTNRACLRSLRAEPFDRDRLVVGEPQRIRHRGGRGNPVAQPVRRWEAHPGPDRTGSGSCAGSRSRRSLPVRRCRNDLTCRCALVWFRPPRRETTMGTVSNRYLMLARS